MTPLQTNKPVFFDGDTPLNGTIYVGQPGTDPRTNPKTVTLQDSGGSQFTASQPLDVFNGKVVYNGKPIVALVDGEYSALLFDIGGKQVDYIRAFDPSGGATGSVDFSEVTRVGLTLNEIKAFDVAVGETVENVGKILATDDLGAHWLAVSATGSPADDIDLIDFNNGLQGERIKNFLYPDSVAPSIADKSFDPESPTLVWSGSSTNLNVTNLSVTTPGFYIVETSTFKQYSLFTQFDLTVAGEGGTGHVVYGTGQSEIVGGTSPFTILQSQLSIFKSGSQRSFIVSVDQLDINNSGTVATNYANTQATITKVYKV